MTRETEECFEKARAVAHALGAHMLERRASCGDVVPVAVGRRASN